MTTPASNDRDDELDEILVDFYNHVAKDIASGNIYNGSVITTAHTKAKQAIQDLYARREAEKEKIYKLVRNNSRMILYNDPIGRPDQDNWRDQVSRDDMWAISTDELNTLCGKITTESEESHE